MQFIEREFVPKTIKNLSVPQKEAVIVPIGDVHYGNKGCAEGAFKRYLETVEDEFEQVYYIGMGDYLDCARATLRKTLGTLAVDDGDALDQYVEFKLAEFLKLIKHTKGKWLGVLAGNHTWTFREGHSVESELCRELDAPFLGDCADLRLNFIRADKRQRGHVGLWVHHGCGGRKYPVGKLIDDICPHFPMSDIFLMGHTHIREYRDFPRLYRGDKYYIERTGVAAITGGWLQGYTEGPSTYVERRPLKPLAIGSLVIKVRPRIHHGLFAPVIRMETI